MVSGLSGNGRLSAAQMIANWATRPPAQAVAQQGKPQTRLRDHERAGYIGLEQSSVPQAARARLAARSAELPRPTDGCSEPTAAPPWARQEYSLTLPSYAGPFGSVQLDALSLLDCRKRNRASSPAAQSDAGARNAGSGISCLRDQQSASRCKCRIIICMHASALSSGGV